MSKKSSSAKKAEIVQGSGWRDIQVLNVITQNEESILCKVQSTDQLPDRIYVCKKVMQDRLLDSQRWRIEDLEQNLRAITRLVHPHIIKCHRYSVTPTSLFILLDYYPMGSLQDRLNKLKGPLPLRSSRVWFAQILGAISYIHARGVTHRNIKLTTLLLKSEEHAILSGFNHHLCLAFKRDAEVMRTTIFKRNLAYRAPEMHSLTAQVWPYDAKAIDVYALGVCLFRMVNYSAPFDVELYTTDQVAYINKQRNREYSFHEKYATHSNAKIKHLISLLLEPKPGIRITASTALLHEALVP